MNPQDIEHLFFLAEYDEAALECDVHGYDADGATHEVELFVHRAWQQGETYVRIIHGHGAGILRRAVQDALRKEEIVVAIRDSLDLSRMGAVTLALIHARRKHE